MQDRFSVVEKFNTRLEAEMAAGLLESEGINARVLADDAGGTYPPLQMVRGVRLVVASDDEARAREILEDCRQAPPLEMEDDFED